VNHVIARNADWPGWKPSRQLEGTWLLRGVVGVALNHWGITQPSHAHDLAARGEWAQAIPDPLGGVSNPTCDLREEE
jgi:hypothetical protein